MRVRRVDRFAGRERLRASGSTRRVLTPNSGASQPSARRHRPRDTWPTPVTSTPSTAASHGRRRVIDSFLRMTNWLVINNPFTPVTVRSASDRPTNHSSADQGCVFPPIRSTLPSEHDAHQLPEDGRDGERTELGDEKQPPTRDSITGQHDDRPRETR